MSDKDLTKRFEQLVRIVENLANVSVAPVLPIAPVAPVAPVAPIAPLHLGDHDTITELATSFKILDRKVDDISAKLDNKYTTKEEHKIVIDTQADHEQRVRIVESAVTKIATWGTALILAIGIIEFLISKFL